MGISQAEPELECLAKNIYFEARGESEKGMLAVATVTLNRVNSGLFPDSICGVVYQPFQFSWTGTKYKITNNYLYEKAKDIAIRVIYDNYIMKDFKATHFHNNTVEPRWKMRKVAVIGNHTFYVK